MDPTFLDLLHDEAPRSAYDALLGELGDDARDQHRIALQMRERLTRHRSREAELSALYETANDLAAIRDLDTILAAIVRRARQLLHADMTYLSLNDVAEGASYMKVTDGALTAEFRQLRLPLGTGLLGLVAQSGAPYFTEDYQADARFLHRDYIDTAVSGESIRAILGVPLIVDGTVIGALLAVHRTVRRFPPGEISLLTSFAAHAAVALENARLFDQAREAIGEVDAANKELRARSAAAERAALSHDRLTDVLLHGGGVAGIAEVLGELLGGSVTIHDERQRRLAGDAPADDRLAESVEQARRSGRSIELEPGRYVVAAAAGEEHLGSLVVDGVTLAPAERRTLERAAIVTALVLLFARTEAEADGRVRGELLTDLLSGRDGAGDRLRERARRQGADLELATCVIAARVEGIELHRAVRVAGRLAGEWQGLAVAHQGDVVLLVAADEPLEVARELQARLVENRGRCTVGVASGAPGPEGIAATHAEARRCVDALIALGRAGEASDPAHLGVARMLLGGGGSGHLDDFLTAELGPLLGHDRQRGTALVDTVEAWFRAGGSLKGAAAQLHVHPNTVGQRLERVDALLGRGWRDPERQLDLQLALRWLHLRRVQ
ncbi:GAF domain-containing protein [Nocardioides sp. JQ2195]|uniref:helix-turn-helix domain-containing protein n=1 Tax=Nocardioides sp. JQ2195 TaxID=2592334 RepID=UPI00143E8CBA|nr:GAF domain-containing protein [Nocardioides sp. JQ2195]QIX25691.1 GAF domain-containing protein [Nocardioides sp. JQ2195]